MRGDTYSCLTSFCRFRMVGHLIQFHVPSTGWSQAHNPQHNSNGSMGLSDNDNAALVWEKTTRKVAIDVVWSILAWDIHNCSHLVFRQKLITLLLTTTFWWIEVNLTFDSDSTFGQDIAMFFVASFLWYLLCCDCMSARGKTVSVRWWSRHNQCSD